MQKISDIFHVFRVLNIVSIYMKFCRSCDIRKITQLKLGRYQAIFGPNSRY